MPPWFAAAILALGAASAGPATASCADAVGGQSVDRTIRQAGSADRLLYLSKGQLEENMNWFAAMEAVLHDPVLPRRPDVLDLYRQGLRTHALEAQLTRALECRLGQPYSEPPSPKSVAEIEASMPQDPAGPGLSMQDVNNLLSAMSGAMSRSAASGGGGYSGGGDECQGMVCY